MGGSTALYDAKTKLSSASHYVYIFQTPADFDTYCHQAGNVTPTPATCPTLANYAGDNGTTYPVQGAVEQSIIFAGNTDASANSNIGQTTAHEVGHQLDDIYGVSLYGSPAASRFSREFGQKLTGMSIAVSGSIHATDMLTVTLTPVGVAPITATYPVVAGDTVTTIATGLAAKINASAIHASPYLGTATSTGTVVSFTLNSPKIVSYTVSTTIGSTEILTLNRFDWAGTNAVTPQCAAANGLFASQKDQTGKFICGTLASGQVTSTPTAGDVYSFIVTDTTGSTINEPVSYPVPASPTPTNASIAAGIILKINGDPVLQARKITAQSGGGSSVQITSGTQTTTYSAPTVTPSGSGHGAFNLSAPVSGAGNTLSNSYSGTNSQVLQKAWSSAENFSPVAEFGTTDWPERFADNTAQVAGQNKGGGQNPSAYYQNNGFQCTLEYVKSVEQTGVAPGTAGGVAYTSNCK